jgi:hypothetical protein
MAQDKSGFPTLDIKAAKALRPNVHQIRIDSILGGIATYEYASAANQYADAAGIAPDWANSNEILYQSSGAIKPTPHSDAGGDSRPPTNNYILWMRDNEKDGRMYMYDSVGSTYKSAGALTGLGDLNDGGTASGNGMAYYDNYMYFARDTTVARYGPLNGTPSFTDDYWVGTLGKTALNAANSALPTTTEQAILHPNHVMHRHFDGKVYIADRLQSGVSGQAVIHYLSTKETTVEGDTDNGSTYNALTLPYGMWITALESYGDNLAIALYEGDNWSTNVRGPRAKLAIWDTTSPSFNLITQDEFPDPYISAMLNSNGILYLFSGLPQGQGGVRVSRYLGGKSFEQVAYLTNGTPPLPGAVDGVMNKIFFGSEISEVIDQQHAAAYSIGLTNSQVSNALHCPMVAGVQGSTGVTTALRMFSQPGLAYELPALAVMDTHGASWLETVASTYVYNTFTTKKINVGQRFKINKITLPFLRNISSSDMPLTVSIIADGQFQYGIGTTIGGPTGATYGGAARAVIRPSAQATPDSLQGIPPFEQGFMLNFVWGGGTTTYSSANGIALPITIEIELFDD